MTAAIEKWVEALESGEFEQGTGRLRSQYDTYCCLGVLCEVAVREGVIPPAELDVVEGAYCYIGEFGGLPKSICDWAGLPLTDPELHYPEFDGEDVMTRESTCIFENDVMKRTFPEIAALIRSKYLETADVSGPRG